MISATEIKRIWVWSTNPVKVQAVQNFFNHSLSHDFEIIAYSAESGVNDQPLSEEETIQWAYNRCQRIMKQDPNIDLAVGLEWWVSFQKDFHGKEQCYLFGVVGIQDSQWFFHHECGGKIIMPPVISQELKNWAELGPLMDRLLLETNIKHKQWTVWVLTNNFVDRESRFSHNIATAFVPWMHPEWFK